MADNSFQDGIGRVFAPCAGLRRVADGDEAALFSAPLDSAHNAAACVRPTVRLARLYNFEALARTMRDWHDRGVFDEFDSYFDKRVLLREDAVRHCADHLNGAAQRAAVECARTLRLAGDAGFNSAMILNYAGAGSYTHVNADAESVACGWHGALVTPLDPATGKALHDTQETDLVRLAGERHANARPAPHVHSFTDFTLSMQGHR